MPGFDHFELKEVKIGGQRVGFTHSTLSLQIAGEEIPLDAWLEIRRRIDLIMKHELRAEEWKALKEKIAWLGKRDRLPPELRDYEPVPAKPMPTWFGENIEAIHQLKLTRGQIRRPPWWLRWMFDAVVDKREYGRN